MAASCIECIDVDESGHMYLCIFALSIFEHAMSKLFKVLKLSSKKLVAGQDTDASYLACALKDTKRCNDFRANVLPFLSSGNKELNLQEEFIVDRFTEAEAFRHVLLANSSGVLPSVQECRAGIRTLQRLLTVFKCDEAAARVKKMYQQLSVHAISSEADDLIVAKFLASNLLGKFEHMLSTWLKSVEAAPYSLYGFTTDEKFQKDCSKYADFKSLSQAVESKRAAKLTGQLSSKIAAIEIL